MSKKLIGILVCILFFGASVISATSFNIKKEETRIDERQLYTDLFLPYDFIQKIKFIIGIGQSVQQTEDNGYIVTGLKGEIDFNDPNSNDGVNTLLMKYSENGDKEWSETFELMNGSVGYSVQQIEDAGYIIGGSVASSDKAYAMLLKTDEQGNEEWMKTYEGLGHAQGTMFQKTDDNRYILTGWSTLHDNINDTHMLLVKTDENGNEEWNKTYEFINNSLGSSVQQTEDQGYIICGYMMSSDKLYSSVLLIKTDISGNEEWNKTYEYMEINRGYSIQQTDDHGYVIGGYMISSEDFKSYALLLKTDENGNEEWHQSYSDKYGFYAQQTEDNGYIISGTSISEYDFYALLLKTDNQGNEEWMKTYEGLGVAQGIMVQQTNDNGYILTGNTLKSVFSLNTYVLLLKTDEEGNLVWSTNLNKNILNNKFNGSMFLRLFERFPLLQKMLLYIME